MDSDVSMALVTDCVLVADAELAAPLANVRRSLTNTRGENPKAWQPVKLSQLQRSILELHLGGFKPDKIADTLGCTRQMVYLTVTSELGKAFVENRLRYVDEDLERLYVKVVDAIEEGLDAENIDLKLKAVDRFERLSTRLAKRGIGKSGGVENMMQKMLELVKTNNDGTTQTMRMTETVPMAREAA